MKLPAFAVAALRSVNGGTGALLGGVALAVFALASMTAMFAIGPSSPVGLGDLFAIVSLFFLMAVGTTLGALVGSLVHIRVSRTRLAGPADRRMVASGLTVAVVLGALSGVQQVVFRYRPRVMRSNGTITRLAGLSALTPMTPATLVFGRSDPISPLKWHDQNVQIAREGQTLIIGRSPGAVDRVSLKGLNDVQEVYGATAALDPKGEWLALLVRLQHRGQRDLLLIYDPAGTLSHQELLAWTPSGRRGPVLGSTGQPGGRQEFMLNLGEPLRYVVQK